IAVVAVPEHFIEALALDAFTHKAACYRIENMWARASAFLLLAACWTSEVKPVPSPKSNTPSGGERRAIVRIDAQPGGKKFQGVWLEFADDKRWLVDYRANELWKPFADREVLVTGYCWAPDPRAQAIQATHFHVERMTFVQREMGRGPILAI